MKRLLLALLTLAVTATGFALAQEPPDPAVLELEIREEMDLFHRGSVVVGAQAYFFTGRPHTDLGVTVGPRTDADGRMRLRVPDGGGTLILFGDGFAPGAYRISSGGEATFHLRSAARLKVRVLGPTGKPVEGASVRMHAAIPVVGATGGDVRAYRYVLDGRTGADGRLVFDGLSADPVTVSAAAEGYVPGERFPVRAGGGEERLTLGEGSRVSGRIRMRPTAGPGPFARVHVGDREAEVGEDGEYEISTVPEGAHEVRVEGQGFVPPEVRTLVLVDGRDRTHVDFDLIRTSTLVAVVKAPKGARVDGVTVRLHWPPTESDEGVPRLEEHDARLGAGGEIRVPGLLPADGVSVEIRRQGFLPWTLPGLSLRPGGETQPLRVTLEVGGVLAGRVTDPYAEPIANAVVGAISRRDDRTLDLGSAVTDGEGVFRLPGIPFGDVDLTVRPPEGHATRPGRFGPVTGRFGETVDIGELRLETGESLSVRVHGAPTDAVLTATRGGEVLARTAVVEGVATLRGIVPGRLELEVTSPSGDGGARGAATAPSLVPVEIPWRDLVDVDVVLVDRFGDPVPEAELRADPVKGRGAVDDPVAPAPEPVVVTVRDEAGLATLRLPEGRWRLGARGADDSFAAVEVQIATDNVPNVRLVLSPGESLRGHVFSRLTGYPVEGATVRAVPVASGDTSDAPVARADEEGWFRIRGVPPGIVRVRVEAPGHAPYESEPVVVQIASAPVIGRIELEQGIRVFGRVTFHDEPSPAGTAVSFTADGNPAVRTRTDVYGRYEVTGLLPGPTIVDVGSPGGGSSTQSRRVYLPHDHELELDFDLTVGTVLQGTISTAGRPEAWADVTAYAYATPGRPTVSVSAQADAFGRYVLAPLPPGPVRIDVHAVGSRSPWRTRVDLPDTLDFLIDLEMPESSVGGQVVDARGGGPVRGARVRVYVQDWAGQPDRIVAEAVSDATGWFRLERVPAGTYDLLVVREGFGSSQVVPIEVDEHSGPGGLRIPLPEQVTFEVRVLDLARNPVPGGWLQATAVPEDATGLRVRAFAAPDGSARLDGLSPGVWSLRAGAPGLGGRDLGEVEVLYGVEHLGEVQLEPESALRVTVFREGLFVRPGTGVLIEDAYGRDPRPPRRRDDPLRGADDLYVTGFDGTVVISGLSRGPYWLSVPGQTTDPVLVRLRDGELAGVFLFAPSVAQE